MSDCICDKAAIIAAVSMPNCPRAWFGTMSKTPKATPPILSAVDRYQGRFKDCVSVSLTRVGFIASGADCLFHQKNGLRTLSGVLFGSVMASSLFGQRPCDEAVHSTGHGGPALDENIVVSDAAGLLAQFCRNHHLHVGLAPEVCDLCLCGEVWIRTRSAYRDLIFHLVRSLKNEILTLIRD